MVEGAVMRQEFMQYYYLALHEFSFPKFCPWRSRVGAPDGSPWGEKNLIGWPGVSMI